MFSLPDEVLQRLSGAGINSNVIVQRATLARGAKEVPPSVEHTNEEEEKTKDDASSSVYPPTLEKERREQERGRKRRRGVVESSTMESNRTVSSSCSSSPVTHHTSVAIASFDALGSDIIRFRSSTSEEEKGKREEGKEEEEEADSFSFDEALSLASSQDVEEEDEGDMQKAHRLHPHGPAAMGRGGKALAKEVHFKGSVGSSSSFRQRKQEAAAAAAAARMDDHVASMSKEDAREARMLKKFLQSEREGRRLRPSGGKRGEGEESDVEMDEDDDDEEEEDEEGEFDSSEEDGVFSASSSSSSSFQNSERILSPSFSSPRSTSTTSSRSASNASNECEEDFEEEEENTTTSTTERQGRIGFRARQRVREENAGASKKRPAKEGEPVEKDGVSFSKSARGTSEGVEGTSPKPSVSFVSSASSLLYARPPQRFRSIYFSTHLSHPDPKAAAAVGLEPKPCHHTLVAFRSTPSSSHSSSAAGPFSGGSHRHHRHHRHHEKGEHHEEVADEDVDDRLPSITIQGPCAVVGGIGGKSKREEMQLGGYFLGRHPLSGGGGGGHSSSSAVVAPPPVVLWGRHERAVLHPIKMNFTLPHTPATPTPSSIGIERSGSRGKKEATTTEETTNGRGGPPNAVPSRNTNTTSPPPSKPSKKISSPTGKHEQTEAMSPSSASSSSLVALASPETTPTSHPWSIIPHCAGGCPSWKHAVQVLAASQATTLRSWPLVDLVFGPGRRGLLFRPVHSVAEREEEDASHPAEHHHHRSSVSFSSHASVADEGEEEEEDVEAIFGPIDWTWVQAELEAWSLFFGGPQHMPSVALLLHPYDPAHRTGARKFYLKGNLRRSERAKKALLASKQEGMGNKLTTTTSKEGDAYIEVPSFIAAHREPMVDTSIIHRVLPQMIPAVAMGVPASEVSLLCSSSSASSLLDPSRRGNATSTSNDVSSRVVVRGMPRLPTGGIGQRIIAVVGNANTGKSVLCRYLTNALLSCQHARRRLLRARAAAATVGGFPTSSRGKGAEKNKRKEGAEGSPVHQLPSPFPSSSSSSAPHRACTGAGEGVLWLDLDLGQSEFGVPGEIGLYLIRKPLFFSTSTSNTIPSIRTPPPPPRPLHTDGVEAIQTYFVGTSTVACPLTMAHAITALCDLVLALQMEHYVLPRRSERQEAAGARSLPSTRPPRPSASTLRERTERRTTALSSSWKVSQYEGVNTAAAVLPVVINTHGWVLHTGRRSTMEVLRRLSPHTVLHLLRDGETCWTSPLPFPSSSSPLADGPLRSNAARLREEAKRPTSSGRDDAQVTADVLSKMYHRHGNQGEEPSFTGSYRVFHYCSRWDPTLTRSRCGGGGPVAMAGDLSVMWPATCAPWSPAVHGLNEEVVKKKFLIRHLFPVSTGARGTEPMRTNSTASTPAPLLSGPAGCATLYRVQLLSRLPLMRSRVATEYATVLSTLSGEGEEGTSVTHDPNPTKGKPSEKNAKKDTDVSNTIDRSERPLTRREHEGGAVLSWVAQGCTTVHLIPVRWGDTAAARGREDAITGTPAGVRSSLPMNHPLKGVEHRRQRWMSYFMPLLELYSRNASSMEPPKKRRKGRTTSEEEEEEEPQTTLLRAPLSAVQFIAWGEFDEKLGVRWTSSSPSATTTILSSTSTRGQETTTTGPSLSLASSMPNATVNRLMAASLEHAVVAVQIGEVTRVGPMVDDNGGGTSPPSRPHENTPREENEARKRNGAMGTPFCGPRMTSLAQLTQGFPVTCYGYVESTEEEMRLKTPPPYSSSSSSVAPCQSSHGWDEKQETLAKQKIDHEDDDDEETQSTCLEGEIRIRVPLAPSVVRALLTPTPSSSTSFGVAVAYSPELRVETGFLEWMQE